MPQARQEPKRKSTRGRSRHSSTAAEQTKRSSRKALKSAMLGRRKKKGRLGRQGVVAQQVCCEDHKNGEPEGASWRSLHYGIFSQQRWWAIKRSLQLLHQGRWKRRSGSRLRQGGRTVKGVLRFVFQPCGTAPPQMPQAPTPARVSREHARQAGAIEEDLVAAQHAIAGYAVARRG